MFFKLPQIHQPPDKPEFLGLTLTVRLSSGLSFEIRLPEQLLPKLKLWSMLLLMISGSAGAGWWVVQTQTSILTPASTPTEVIQPQK